MRKVLPAAVPLPELRSRATIQSETRCTWCERYNLLVKLSLVIPAYNEAEYLPRLLDSVDIAARNYMHGEVEVIVADNGSRDATAEIALARKCRVIRVEKRIIAAVRNGGAAVASGDILCFVDADMRIHPQTFDVILATLSSGRYVGGTTGATPERWSFGIAVSWAALLPLQHLLRIDTGVVFCRRQDFLEMRGYDETMAFAEDIRFLWDLRRLGRARTQRLIRATSARAVVSLRKFDEYGDWHYFTMIGSLALSAKSSRHRFSEFVDRYWYNPNR